jgi:hypothetical protein
MRTTSWVVFWLGNLAKARAGVDARVLEAGAGYLRKGMDGACAEMRARVLTALAAAGKAEKKDAEFSEEEAGKLSTAGRLLAIYGGASMAAPPKEKWAGLNALEMSVLVMCLADG